MLKSIGCWAALMSVPVVSGCLERVVTADPLQRVSDAQALDGQVVDRGASVDAMAPLDAMPAPVDAQVDALPPPVDAQVDALPPPVDALPPPVDAATVATDCVLPDRPPRDCSPANWGLGDAVALAFQPAIANSQFDPNLITLANGCWLAFPEGGQYDFGSEAEFQAAVECFEGIESIPSSIDWAASRLVLAMVDEGLGDVIWMVTQADETRMGIDVGTNCGGAPPEGGFVGALIAANAPPLGESQRCWPDLGPQGCCACEVICDPEPRLGECDCPP